MAESIWNEKIQVGVPGHKGFKMTSIDFYEKIKTIPIHWFSIHPNAV